MNPEFPAAYWVLASIILPVVLRSGTQLPSWASPPSGSRRGWAPVSFCRGLVTSWHAIPPKGSKLVTLGSCWEDRDSGRGPRPTTPPPEVVFMWVHREGRRQPMFFIIIMKGTLVIFSADHFRSKLCQHSPGVSFSGGGIWIGATIFSPLLRSD